MPTAMNWLQTKRPRAVRALVLSLVLCGLVGAGSVILRKPLYAANGNTIRSVQGRVIDTNEVPIRSAIVYLTDTRTMAVESYITQEDGAYRFEQLSQNDDYKLWAQADGKKSKTRILSSFDDRSVFHVILKIDGAK